MQHSLNRIIKYLAQITGIIYVFIMLKQFYHPDAPMFAIPFHVFITTALVLLFFPFNKKEEERKTTTMLFDLLGFSICIFLAMYYWMNVERMQLRFEMIDPVFLGEKLAFWVGIPLILEGVRRTIGWSLLLVVLGFLIYGFGIIDLPGLLYFSGFKLNEYVEITMLGTEGVFGVASNAMITMVFYFILFGAVFSATRGGDLFIDLSLLVSGKFKGGAAKSAVIASALFGMISGSAVANVTSTGVLTIPLMKRTGYTAEQAAATEAVASSGGQIMPPIMGVAAFVMAELLGVPYSRIAIAGFIPAIGYYIAIFLSVDLLARKLNIGSVDYALLKQNTVPIIPRIHLLLSPIAIVLCIFMGYSVPFSALLGTAIAAMIPILRKNTWYPFKDIFKMIINTSKQMAKISVAVSAIGVIIAISIQSGLAIRFVTILADIGKDNLILSLFLIILGCLVLGLGLPTIAAYIIGGVIFVPAITRLGIQPLAAHFFVLYYSVLSLITPPVCIAAFAAAGIADANPNKTGFLAFGMGLTMFFIPFGFVQDMSLLGVGSTFRILMAGFGVLCATSSWAIALQGWLGGNLNILIRGIFTLLCFLIIFAKTLSIVWSASIFTFFVLTLFCFFKLHKNSRLIN